MLCETLPSYRLYRTWSLNISDFSPYSAYLPDLPALLHAYVVWLPKYLPFSRQACPNMVLCDMSMKGVDFECLHHPADSWHVFSNSILHRPQDSIVSTAQIGPYMACFLEFPVDSAHICPYIAYLLGLRLAPRIHRAWFLSLLPFTVPVWPCMALCDTDSHTHARTLSRHAEGCNFY